MSSRKTTPNKVLVLGAGAALLLGIVLGLAIGNIPYVAFKNEVDTGSVLSLAALFATVFIMPFVVERFISNQDNTHHIMVADLDGCLDTLKAVAKLYGDYYVRDKTIKKQERKVFLTEVRRATNCLDSLAKEFDNHADLKDFRQKVYDKYLTETYAALTDSVNERKKIRENQYLVASSAIDKHISVVKKFRYRVYK
jgi:hypothetical protein